MTLRETAAAGRGPSAPPEDSIAIRVAVAVAVEIGIVAVVLQGAVDAVTAVASLVLAPLGYWFSYRSRSRRNLAVKLVLSVALLAALAQFLQAVRFVGSVDQARLPLASLFLWVQVLHAFDVPRRRDLSFSMVSSVILIAEAGALSLTTSFGLLLLAWCAPAGAWLWLSSRPRADQVTAPVSVRRIASERRPPRLAAARSVGVAGVATVVAAALLFLAMPRLPGTIVRTPPFQLGGARPPSVGGEQVVNPGLPSAGGDGVVDFAPNAYPGFEDVMDLRARGGLSQEIAFRVRTPQPSLWRGEAFETYRDGLWTVGDDTTFPLVQGDDGAMEVPPEASYPPATVPPIAKLVQTVYVETAQPNTVFGAGEISRVYFPSAGLRATRNGSVRSPLLLEEGMVYSVVSDVPVVSDALLRQLPWAKPKGMDPYLQVPADMPARVGALAARITAGTPTQVEAVEAVQSWLRRQTTYDLEVAREPAGAEPLDHFLFETRTGFCEHIASAMAILLREVGIPTRLVTGYGPGTRNPFTGYQEVRQADAHAWVEVYYPVVGWLPYDPTFGVPASDPGLSSRFMAGPVFAAVGRFVRDVVPEPVKAAAGAAGRGVLRAATTVLDTWPLLVGIVAVLAAAGAMLVRRRGRARAGPPPTGAAAAFVDLTAALTDRGHPWAPQQTASEYLAEVLADAALADEIGSAAELVVRTFERERYAMPKPAEAEVIRARAAAARVHDLVG